MYGYMLQLFTADQTSTLTFRVVVVQNETETDVRTPPLPAEASASAPASLSAGIVIKTLVRSCRSLARSRSVGASPCSGGAVRFGVGLLRAFVVWTRR